MKDIREGDYAPGELRCRSCRCCGPMGFFVCLMDRGAGKVLLFIQLWWWPVLLFVLGFLLGTLLGCAEPKSKLV